MTNWLAVILPILTLILGAALTMASQAIQDRRIAAREKRAQRQSFMATNFEVHRTAMLEMQELVRDYYQAFLTEKVRRESEGFYLYFDERSPRAISARILSGRASIDRINEAIQATSSGEIQRKELEKIIKKQAKDSVSSFNMAAEGITEMRAVLEGLYPFWDESVLYIQKLRLCEFRSGSNSVVKFGEAYIDSIFKWSEVYVSGRSDELTEEVLNSRREVDRALSNALKYGPYDTSGNES
jgi:hypothetical protein